MILALEAERLHVGLVFEIARDVPGEAVVERAFGELERERRPRGEPPDDVLSCPIELGRGHGTVDKPNALGLRRADRLAQEEQLDRLGHPPGGRRGGAPPPPPPPPALPPPRRRAPPPPRGGGGGGGGGPPPPPRGGGGQG